MIELDVDVDSVVRLQLLRNRGTKLRSSGARDVMRVACLQSLDGGTADVFWRGEIGLATPKIDDVPPLLPQGSNGVGDRHGRRRLHLEHASRKMTIHSCPLGYWT